MSKPLIVSSAVLALTTAASAQMDWQLINTAASPNAPFHTAIAFDIARSATVLFGGTNNAQDFAETWEYGGGTWTQITTANAPSPRHWARMAYNLGMGETVLFGGNNGSAETWAYDGTNWTQRTPATQPPGRSAHAMWFDLSRQRVMMFGGLANPGGQLLNDTWSWDGTDWTQLQPANQPQGLFSIEVAYDLTRDRAVLFGGAVNSGGTVPVDETWEWDGTDWTLITTPTTPLARWGAKLVFDTARNRVVMVAGVSNGTTLDDTWEYDGYDWHNIQTATRITSRENHALAYDFNSNIVIAYGGYPPIQDTWEYTSGPGGQFTPYGAGCPGSAGTPTLTTAPGSVPAVGQAFVMDILNLPSTTALALAVVGESIAANQGVPLPLDLASLGMPSCSLFVGNVSVVGVAAAGGAATWTLSIPNNPLFLGFSFFPQVAIPDAAANGAGLTVSNAAEAIIR